MGEENCRHVPAIPVQQWMNKYGNGLNPPSLARALISTD